MARRPETELQEIQPRDSFLHENESGGLLVDLIRINWTKGRSTSYMAQGFVYFEGKLFGFRAYNTSRVSFGEQNWSLYVPFDPRTMYPLINTQPYSRKDWERLRQQFPQAFPLEKIDYETYQRDYLLPETASRKQAFHELVAPGIVKAELLYTKR